MTQATSVRYRFGRFELLPEERQLLADGAVVRLGPHAFDLLVVLVEYRGKLVTKDDLLSRVWPRAVVEENTLQVHVSALRKVLGAESIATVSGRGYRFMPDVERDSPRKAPKHNLPHQLTSFIGRERQIDEILELLGSTRLLTLTGAGGCGKTRLAMKVAEALTDRFEDGVWLTDLAPLGDSTLVVQAVANALQIDEQSGKPLQDLVTETLASKSILLVLDNAEHVLGACAQLADLLLQRCTRLVMLVTSRERLGLAGEVSYRVPSLTVATVPQGGVGVEALACEAARLFIERARLQQPDFAVAPRDADTLASICHRLDGIALAIELAAPRIRHMSMLELSRHLDRRFNVLTGGSRTALPRHRTLRALIDWSYDLLDPAEKTLLQRVSVFAGGWTLEAAERVCSDDGIERGRVPTLLKSLADKNLVLAESQAGGTRFGMLETVRHYARDCLQAGADEEVTCSRHVEYLLGVAEALDAAPNDAERHRLLDRLERELDNLRAAFAWCESSVSRSFTGLRLAGRLHWLWYVRGFYAEGRRWIGRLLAVAPDAEETDAHAVAFQTAGTLAFIQGDLVAAEANYRGELRIAQRLGQRGWAARALGSLGNITLGRGDTAAARDLYQQALDIARELGDRRRTAVGLHCLGLVATESGDLDAAQTYLEESMAIGREIGNRHAAHVAQLGWVRHLRGDHTGAIVLFEEALEGARLLGDKGLRSKMLCMLGEASLAVGDLAGASRQLAEAIEIHEALGEKAPVAETLVACAGAALQLHGPAVAASVWGAAERLREEMKLSLSGVDRGAYQRRMAHARSLLQDDAAFDRHWNDGKAWTLGEAMQFALDHLN